MYELRVVKGGTVGRTKSVSVRIISAARNQHPTHPNLESKGIYWLNWEGSNSRASTRQFQVRHDSVVQ